MSAGLPPRHTASRIKVQEVLEFFERLEAGTERDEASNGAPAEGPWIKETNLEKAAVAHRKGRLARDLEMLDVMDIGLPSPTLQRTCSMDSSASSCLSPFSCGAAGELTVQVALTIGAQNRSGSDVTTSGSGSPDAALGSPRTSPAPRPSSGSTQLPRSPRVRHHDFVKLLGYDARQPSAPQAKWWPSPNAPQRRASPAGPSPGGERAPVRPPAALDAVDSMNGQLHLLGVASPSTAADAARPQVQDSPLGQTSGKLVVCGAGSAGSERNLLQRRAVMETRAEHFNTRSTWGREGRAARGSPAGSPVGEPSSAPDLSDSSDTSPGTIRTPALPTSVVSPEPLCAAVDSKSPSPASAPSSPRSGLVSASSLPPSKPVHQRREQVARLPVPVETRRPASSRSAGSLWSVKREPAQYRAVRSDAVASTPPRMRRGIQ